MKNLHFNLLFLLFSFVDVKVVQSIQVGLCAADEKCQPIESCKYESQFLLEKRFDQLKFCGVYLVDTLHCCKIYPPGSELPEESVRIDSGPDESSNSSIGLSSHVNIHLINNAIFCGKSLASRGNKGSEASLNQFPWLALLEYRPNKPGDLVIRCAGTLISEHYVLTAASCESTRNSELTSVRLGEHTISNDPECVEALGISYCNPPHESFGVESFLAHEDYNPETKQNDIALIRLSGRIVLSKPKFNIKPICLPVEDFQEIDHSNDVDPKLSIAGWGRTGIDNYSDVLQFAELDYLPNENCTQYLDAQKKKFRLISINVDETNMCASSKKAVDLCKGDVGAPLTGMAELYNTNLRTFQQGIVSHTIDCSGNGPFPGVYTRVSQYMHWILDNMSP